MRDICLDDDGVHEAMEALPGGSKNRGGAGDADTFCRDSGSRYYVWKGSQIFRRYSNSGQVRTAA